MSKKLLSMLLVLVMLFSIVVPAIPVSATESESATVSEPTSDLRIGVLSDIHVSYDYVDETYGSVSGYFNGVQPSRFEKALRFYKSQGVDAVVIAGDLQEASGTDAASLDKQKDWLQTVVDIWFKVFPETKGEDGYVEPIFTYGNHDSALVGAQYWPEEWGTYEDVFVKEVNGYSFVCTHNAKEHLAAPLLADVVPENQDKPVFYIQHCPVYNTVPSSTGGYGVGYGQNGWSNVAPYHNVVVLNGHTHVPLTDERSIWQGDAGNEGQFTVLNTATINYSGLGNDDMSINGYNGNAQQTEHGLLIDVTGSDVTVDRYSFNDMTIDTATGTVSGNAVKLGETWQWDACDITDRPYAYDSRYENANAPQFGDGASVTVSSITDTSVKVVIPAASIEAPSGFSDLIEGYVVEACNPTSGEVEATGRVATSYHVDGLDDAFEDTYTVTVSGLKAGTNYTLKVYAQEFFDKRSEPLTVDITTTGAVSNYRRGDVNLDGNIDQADMNELKAAIAAFDKTGYAASADIDLNGILEERDITELQAILDATRVTYPESTDLMDLVHQVKLTGVSTSANYQPVDYGTTIQNQVVRGDSNQGVKTWTTNYAYYPITTMYFSEPVDLSGYTHFSFDTLFENEYNLSNSYQKRWLSVSFISGNQEQIASYGSMNFDSGNNGWDTKVISLATLKNIDLTAVTGIRFSHNFDYYEGRFDGVTEHAIYWDNFHGLVIEGADSDLLNGATVTGGNLVFGAGYTNNTNQAIQSTGGTLDFTFATEKVLTDYAGIKVDIRTPITTTVSVQALGAEGNPVGTAVTVNSVNIYQNVMVSVPAMGLEEGTVVAGLRFTYTCDSLLLDNMILQGAKDDDLIGTASSFNPLGGNSCNALITTEGTNGSNNALYASAAPGTSVWSGGGELVYDTPLDLSKTPYLRLDMKVQNAHWAFTVVLYNSEGEEIWRTLHYNATSSGGKYATYEFDLRTYRTHEDGTGYVNHEVPVEKLKDVAKITLTADLASSPKWMTSNDTALREVWFDNLVACNPLEDFFGAETGLIGPTAVQDGFVCEILPSTMYGHTNVLHWYSDSANNSGSTSNWPGSTYVSFTKDVIQMNHSGYTGSYDYLEFDIKTVGMYIAMYLTVKDANGATLGSTGEYRISYEQEWSTFRVDAEDLKMSAEDFNKIAQVEIGWNWQHQNATGTATQYVADVYIDNMGLRCVDAESTDLLDQLTSIQNADWWTGGNGKFTGGGWKFQSDITADSDKAFMFYRSETSQNISYGGGKTLYLYFLEPVTVESGWSLELDAIKHNYNASAGKVQIIASDGNKYDLFSFTHTESGVHTYSTLVDAISGFDPDTMTITGLYFTYPMNPDSTMDKTADGYMVLDNLNVAIPEPMDEDDFLYTATCPIGQNQTAVANNSLSAWKISPTGTGWSYPQFTLREAVDISDHSLVMDILPANMTSFRMHLANINGEWIDGAAVHYEPGEWVTVTYDLSTNSKGITSMSAFSLGFEVSAADGVTDYALYVDNVRLVDNNPEPTIYELDGLDLIGTAGSVVITDATIMDTGFVFETLDTVDNRANVVHMYSDPANGGGRVASSTYVGAHIIPVANTQYVTTGIDFIELDMKTTNIYCDSYFIFVLDADGNTLGSTYKRAATTTDWATYRIDLATLGVTADELDKIASVKVGVTWYNQGVSLETAVAGEVYIDDVAFGSYVDTSTDMFDHIASIQNVEWWWSGNNYYDNAGWLMKETETGSSYFELHRVKDKTSTSAGYSPRRQYLYFDAPIILAPNGIIRIDANNTYMGTGTMISLIGDDGNKYGYLKLNQSGAMTYEIAVSDIMLLNANTGMTATTTPIDVTSVKIIGAIFHNDFFNGDATQDGTLVMDNFCFITPEPEPTDEEILSDILAHGDAQYSGRTVGDEFVYEILDSKDDKTNVLHWYADPTKYADQTDGINTTDHPAEGYGGTYGNWLDPFYVDIDGDASKSTGYDISAYDYLQFRISRVGAYNSIGVTLYNTSGTQIGTYQFNGAIGLDASAWQFYRVPLAMMDLTEEEMKSVAKIAFGYNWRHSNPKYDGGFPDDVTQVAEIVIDDLCFSNANDDTDLISDAAGFIQYYQHRMTGITWDMQTDLTNNSGEALLVSFDYDSPNTTNGGWKWFTTTYAEPIQVESDWVFKLDALSSNFWNEVKLSIIGSDGKEYTNTNFRPANDATWYSFTSNSIGTYASSGVAFDPATVSIAGIRLQVWVGQGYRTTTERGSYFAIDNVVLHDPSDPNAPTALDDAIANYKSLTKPSAVESGFVCEVLGEADDGHTDVIHWYSDPNNGSGTTSNWPGETTVYLQEIPSYADTSDYEYLEFSYKHTGTYYDISLVFYDAAGTTLGTTGTVRTAYGSGWTTHRVDLDAMGLTAEELLQISYFKVSGISWKYQNTTATDKRIADMYLDDVRFVRVSGNEADLIGQVAATVQGGYSAINNTGYGVSLINATEDNTNSFSISRGPGQSSWLSYTMNFNEGITVGSEWVFSVDFLWDNFHHDPTLYFVDSAGTKYTVAKPNAAADKSISITMEDAGIADGTVITGMYLSYSAGTSANVDDTVGGSITFSNMLLTAPNAE